MKKIYTALFALIFGLVPAYTAACELLCGFRCGRSNQVQQITITQTPDVPQAPAAPALQAMEAPAPVIADPMPTLALPAPVTATIEPLALPATPARTERKALPLVPLTEKQKKHLLKIRTSTINARGALEAGLVTIPEDEELHASIPATFSERHPVPKPKHDHKRLLNALRLRRPKEAQEILKTDISAKELNAKSSTGKTPLLYAIQQASLDSQNPTDNVYWDIVADLIAYRDIQLPLPSEIRNVVSHEKQHDCLLKYASVTMAY